MFEWWLNFLPLKIYGLQTVFSTAEKGLWYDSDQDVDHLQEGAGIVFKIRWGWVLRPYTKIRWWGKDVPSKWKDFDSKYHGLIRFWFPICPFISISFGRLGFYIGFKAFNLQKMKYAPYVGQHNIKPGNQALTLSLTIRASRYK